MSHFSADKLSSIILSNTIKNDTLYVNAYLNKTQPCSTRSFRKKQQLFTGCFETEKNPDNYNLHFYTYTAKIFDFIFWNTYWGQ